MFIPRLDRPGSDGAYWKVTFEPQRVPGKALIPDRVTF